MSVARDAIGPEATGSIWTADGRVGRLHYFLVVLATSVAGSLLGSAHHLGQGPAGLALVLFIPLIWLAVVAAIKRCHDRGHSGWYVLLSLIPFVNLALGVYLLFAPGAAMANEYGPAPPDAAGAVAHEAAPPSTPAAKTAIASASQSGRSKDSAPASGAAQPSPALAPSLSAPDDEQLWARALAECDGTMRRPGLWAREFAKAGGIEHAAKAGYMAARFEEMKQEIEREDEERRLALASEQRERIAQMDTLRRCAHLRAQQDKVQCPNDHCRSVLPADSTVCPRCEASFEGPDSWKPGELTSPVSVSLAVAALERNGYTVDEIAGGWRIVTASDGAMAGYAFTPEDLAGLGQLADGRQPLALWIDTLLTSEERAQLLPKGTHRRIA